MQEELRAEIERLRAGASPLEPDSKARRLLGERALDHVLAYHDQIAAASTNRPWSEVFAQRLEPEFTDEGRDPERVLDYVAECVDRPGFATTSPKFMAYIPGGGLFHSAMGDMLAAASNKYSGFASASPGAVRIENAVKAVLAQGLRTPDIYSEGTTKVGTTQMGDAVVKALKG